jgi:hypothetical protein
MAAGWPTDVSYADGDVFSASDINDTNGTLNYINPTSATDNQVLTRDNVAPGKVKWANSPANTLTTTGDLYYASAANTPNRLAIGTSGQLLSVTGGVPAWTSVSSGMTLIQNAAGTGTTVTFSSIPSTYTSLMLIGYWNGNSTTVAGNGTITCNGANFAGRYGIRYGATYTTNSSSSTATFGYSSSGNQPFSFQVLIPSYKLASGNKTMLYSSNTGAYNNQLPEFGGSMLVQNTPAAISSLTLTVANSFAYDISLFGLS